MNLRKPRHLNLTIYFLHHLYWFVHKPIYRYNCVLNWHFSWFRYTCLYLRRVEGWGQLGWEGRAVREVQPSVALSESHFRVEFVSILKYRKKNQSMLNISLLKHKAYTYILRINKRCAFLPGKGSWFFKIVHSSFFLYYFQFYRIIIS